MMGAGVLEVRWLAGHTEVMTCGDNLSDLSRFAVADRRIASANAHPAVLAAADVVVGSNAEDGVLRFHEADYFAGCPTAPTTPAAP